MNPPLILDSTLREGEQTPGVCFPIHIKAAIASQLESMGIDIIEAGHPLVSNVTAAGVEAVGRQCRKSRVAAHARSREEDIDAALERGVGMIGIFYCVSDQRLRHHDITLNGAIDQICRTIRRCKEMAPQVWVRYTPEDTVRSPWNNVLEAARAACEAGADIISVADTTGAMIPGGERSMERYIQRLHNQLSKLSRPPRIAVHCHNDRGLALANALDGWRGGADIIDASVMGLGERAGIVDLATLLAVLTSDFGQENRWDLTRLPALYRMVSEFARHPVSDNAPVMGRYAFTHCAGVHTQAAMKDPTHYESLDPSRFGREREVSLDQMSGLSSVRYALEQIGFNQLDPAQLSSILQSVKEIGLTGRLVDREELRWLAGLHTSQRVV